ncbi:MAG: TonB C-terminal domain-containing protein [Rhodospirillales bacterium]|nr:TonB C-terminal domain-containing protein [Rhodospirillales bacterium]MCW8862754.1 TonB C-terminal domain-containing protein [Rhodospirillales bacterium]MCW8953251.1 TonB C-terminal domain-containing protein [Rhodospirillales bacterium]MCW8970931.1 TonB C-terminal domain-containing protein [Rhodospirillales bacterium]MCW9001152.1 TonB C-terminal domain-containing protein [Rhodospirillales bacterium]
MRGPLSLSVALHVIVAIIGYFGLPHLRSTDLMVDAPVVVELVTVAEKTNLPKAPDKPEESKEPEKKPPPPPPPEAKAPPPPPPPTPAPKEPEPEPEPEPTPAPKVAAVPPPPEDKPKAKAKPQPPKALDKVKPVRKPKAPDPFASVLKTVEKMKAQPQPEQPEKKPEPKKEDFASEISRVLAKSNTPMDTSQPMTLSEIDAVRQQIVRCWNLPAGAKDAENMVVDVSVFMRPDGMVQEARLKADPMRQGDPFYRAFSESALRAVLNPRCQPFKLPPEKYERWKTMTLHFNPREMF